jgi:methylmalonyl-CoA mutase C-terminal domain/subunit
VRRESLEGAALGEDWMQKPIKVLVAKPGLDGHDRGAKIVANALRDAGMEVIYTGLHQTPEMIVETAIQEDVDVIALSVLSGAHLTLFKRVRELMEEGGLGDVPVLGGGIIPDADVGALKEIGVSEVFGPGTDTRDIADYIRTLFENESKK